MEHENLVGAIDIVAAFTALRHDVKTQIRSGRELQEQVVTYLSNLDAQMQSTITKLQSAVERSHNPTTTDSSTSSNQARHLAEALAEVEEALQRSIDAIGHASNPTTSPAQLLTEFDTGIAAMPWWSRRQASARLATFRQRLFEAAQVNIVDIERLGEGLRLAMMRVHRFMQSAGLQRVNVLGRPFDAELMYAVDTVAASDIAPNHVAEQLRPAYLWNGKLLRTAEVRLAK